MTEKKPRIRFAGFDDDWEQRKLGDVGSVSMCHRVFKEQTSDSGDIPFYKIGTFGEQADAYISNELFTEYKKKYAYPQKGDILISASGSIGRIVEFTGKNEYFQDSNIVWLSHDNRLDNLFLKCFYSVVKWAGIEESTIKRLYNDNILNTVISMPIVNEQKKIGTYFTEFDKLITLHQRKYDKLVNVKKSMLEKMFPKNGANVPEIRFVGFTKDWERRKWSDTVDISTEMVDPKSGKFNELPHVAPGNIESFTGQLYDNIKLVKDENLISGKFHFYDGDIIYGKINPQLGKYVFARFEGITSADAYVLNAKNGLVQEYLYSILQTRNFFNYSVSVSKRSGIPKINRDELSAYSFLAPKKEEQKQIGDMLLSLDHLIALQRRKVEKLQSIKKACIEKMFV